MAGHAHINCFLLFTYNQSPPLLEPPGKQRQEWEEDAIGMSLRGRGSILLAQVFPVLEKQTRAFPSSGPHDACPLSPFPSKLLGGVKVLTTSISFLLVFPHPL